MTKKKDDTRYNVKDKSVGSFQLRSMLEYAETLGMMSQLEDNEKKVMKGVEFLQKYCRKILYANRGTECYPLKMLLVQNEEIEQRLVPAVWNWTKTMSQITLTILMTAEVQTVV
jgi:hypothetical protein